ncbi:MAG: hypothetical protein AAF399_27955, partial [Bacteroidota bacterium]
MSAQEWLKLSRTHIQKGHTAQAIEVALSFCNDLSQSFQDERLTEIKNGISLLSGQLNSSQRENRTQTITS